MPSIARTHQLTESLLYHVFSRGHNRNNIFYESDDYRYFIKLLSDYSKRHELQIYHWVIMSNHYHLVMEVKEPERISSIMAGIARSYVYYHHRKYSSEGYLWQGRFKSQAIQKELYLLACGRYIERNPVKANIANLAWEYPYSSATYYALDKNDNLTAEDPLFNTFGKNLETARERYKEFLQSFNPEEENLFRNLEFPRGSKEFIRRLIKEKGHFLPRRQGKPRK